LPIFVFQLKRFLSISFLSIYLFFSLGLVVSLHYCSGNLASLNLFEKASCCCDDEKEIKKTSKDDCCKDEVKTVKIADEQIQSKFALDFAGFAMIALKPMEIASTIQFQQPKNIIFKSSIPRPPDDLFLIPIYKKVHSFIFYS
jgi:hypothetical protein